MLNRSFGFAWVIVFVESTVRVQLGFEVLELLITGELPELL